MGTTRAFAAVLVLSFWALPTPSSAQSPAPPKWTAVEQAVGKENYAEAKKQADAILQRGPPEDRQKTMLVYGRILLSLGQKDQARQYLNMLSSGEKGTVPLREAGHQPKVGQGLSPFPSGGEQLAVYNAWLKALDKPDEGIKALETMLEKAGGAPNEATAEAADVLAMLYMGRGEQEKAKKAVDFGLNALQYCGVKSGYILALLRGRLKSDIAADEAKRLYNEAEKLRAAKKFLEAGQLFAQVRAMETGTVPSGGKTASTSGNHSEWHHASGFRIGQCYVGLNHPAQAIDWWQKFLKQSPAGPWRGQAHVALVDATLEQLDLKKATEHAMSASNVLGKLGEEKGTVPLSAASKGTVPFSAPDTSWKDAAYDIHLRQGVVSLVDGRFDAAVQGFQQARGTVPSGGKATATANTSSTAAPGLSPSAPPRDALAGLDRLIEAAQNRAKLVPDELTVGDDRARTALALGNIYNVLHQYDQAKAVFSLPLSGPMRSRSAGHRSFAGLGLARAVIASGQAISSASFLSHGERAGARATVSPLPSGEGPGVRANVSPRPSGEGLGVRAPLLQAKAICEASLTEYPKGSWHDETLYRLATVIQDMADAEFGKPSVASTADGKDGKKPSQPAKPSAPPQRDAKAEKERHAALVQAKSEALPHWQDIIKRYPQSPRCEQAFYYAGVLLYDLAEAASGDKSDQMATDADSLFKRLCETYPKSPYVGDACVRQIDFALERKYDLKLAAALSDRGLQWAKNQDVQVVTAADGTVTRKSLENAAKAIQNASAKLPEWAQGGTKPADSLLNDLYNLYLRAGILAYLQEKYDESAKYFEAAGPARPTEGMQARFDRQKVGLFILKECSRLKEPSWNPDAVKTAKTDSQRLALKLADTYVHSQRPDKAQTIYEQLLAGDSSLGRPSTAVEAYCLMQLALAHSKSSQGVAKATELYTSLYKPEYAKCPWTPVGILRLGVLTFNATHDAKKAMPHYEYVFTKYPDHPEAERALYFYCVAAVQLGDKALIERSIEQFLTTYPKSAWKQSVVALKSEKLSRPGSTSQGDKR